MNSLKWQYQFEKHIPIIKEIANEPGLVLHLQTQGGAIHNFYNKTTRFVDRFFIRTIYPSFLLE